MSLRDATTGHPRSRSERLRAPAIVAVGGLASVLLLRLRDPHAHASYGICPFHALTTWWCPACGGLRAVNDLGRGDVPAALSSNVLVVLLVVCFAAFYLRWVARRWRASTAGFGTMGDRTLLWVCVVAVVFTVVRNTPWGAALAP